MAQDDASVLAQLVMQATDARGADAMLWRAIVEEAGELGASRALSRLGLEDAGAAKDMAELRDLLTAWREAKKSLWQALFGWVVRMALVLVLAGLAVKLGLSGVLK